MVSLCESLPEVPGGSFVRNCWIGHGCVSEEAAVDDAVSSAPVIGGFLEMYVSAVDADVDYAAITVPVGVAEIYTFEGCVNRRSAALEGRDIGGELEASRGAETRVACVGDFDGVSSSNYHSIADTKGMCKLVDARREIDDATSLLSEGLLRGIQALLSCGAWEVGESDYMGPFDPVCPIERILCDGIIGGWLFGVCERKAG